MSFSELSASSYDPGDVSSSSGDPLSHIPYSLADLDNNSSMFPNFADDAQDLSSQQTSEMEHPQPGQEFSNEYTEQSSQEAVLLARVGTDQARLYVPTAVEYTNYFELLQGYFEKLKQWKEILYSEGMLDSQSSIGLRGVYIVRSENSLSIHPGIRPTNRRIIADEPPPNTILEVCCAGELGYSTPTGLGYSTFDIAEKFFIKPTPAGRLLLDEMEDVSYVKVGVITSSSVDGTPTSYLDIEAYLSSDAPQRPTIKKNVSYILRESNLEIRRGEYGAKPMSDEFAKKLFETLDDLILDNTSPTAEPERIASLETQLPAPKVGEQ